MQEHGGRSSSAREAAAADRGSASTAYPHPGEGIGLWLRQRREAFGLTVAEVSQALKLRASYIEAMEAEAFGELPGRTYTAGYVRSLALALGLNPEEAAARLRAAWPPEVTSGPPVAPFAKPTSERRFPMSLVLSLSLAVAVAGYAYWYVNQSAEIGRPLLSPVAELETGPDEPMAADLSEPKRPAPGPLQLLGVPELAQSLDAVHAIGPSADSTQIATADRAPMPDGPFPRPRPGTDAAVQFAATYAPSRSYEDGLAADPAAGMGGLPEASSLAAYLPVIGLRADLGPLRSGVQLPAMAHAAHSARDTSQPAVAAPVGRTQAFAAVPPAGLPMSPIMAPKAQRSEQEERALHDPMASLAPAGSEDGAPLVPVAILADEPCWIEIHARDGEVLVQRLLQPGDRLDVPSAPGLTLTAGNAGGIRILVDGVTAAAIGGIGQVVRGVPLNPHRLLAHR